MIRIYGVTPTGNSVTTFVHGFEPYFLIEAPNAAFGPDECESLRKELNAIAADNKSAQRLGGFCVKRVTMQQGKSIWFYQDGGDRTFLRITVALPNLVAPLRSALERGAINVPLWGCRPVTTYESNVLFALRFMIDRKVQRITIRTNHTSPRPDTPPHRFLSFSTLTHTYICLIYDPDPDPDPDPDLMTSWSPPPTLLSRSWV